MLPTTHLLPADARSDWVRLRTLNYLRWQAILGQSVAILIATQVLDIELRLDLCFLAIALSAAFNFASRMLYPLNKRLDHRIATRVLLFDLAQLGVLLYLSGGLNNPFAVLLLAPTIISATVLTVRSTLGLGLVTLLIVTLLSRVYMPLQTSSGEILEMPQLLIYGMWAALLVAVTFLGVYARRVSTETFGMSQALSATQLALERERKLTALGGVVAAAAHEMGTPLATIKLVSSELADELGDLPGLREDAELIRSQAERCAEILAGMGKTGKDDLLLQSAPFTAVIREAAEPHLQRGINIILRANGETDIDAVQDQPVIQRQPELIHGVRNLVQNAVDFASQTVWIDIGWDEGQLKVVVGDDGKGFPPDMIERIGDPFMRTDPDKRQETDRPGYDGMGLGLFIAKTLLERSGAALTFANGVHSKKNAPPASLAHASGAIVELVWNRSSLEVPPEQQRKALGDNQPVLH